MWEDDQKTRLIIVSGRSEQKRLVASIGDVDWHEELVWECEYSLGTHNGLRNRWEISPMFLNNTEQQI